MKTKTRIYYALLSVMLSSLCSVKSQVTIGSNLKPLTGAVLDLKQLESAGGNANAKKGLILPRVNLTDWSNLFPMFSADADYVDNVGGTKDNYDKNHVGLVVYNLNSCLNTVTADGTGIYVWNGERWAALADDLSSLASGVQAHTDQDGNTFYSGDFGPAGRWMLYNLRAKKYADGTPLPASPSIDFSTDEPKWLYPEPDGGDGTNDKWVNDFEPLGLLYNGYAALRGYKLYNLNQGQIAGPTPGPYEVESIGPNGPDAKGNRYIQGICPNGWHIPSDRNWNELEKEIYDNREKYSSYISTDVPFSPAKWDPAWETQSTNPGTWFRGSDSSTGHNWSMIAPCQTSIFENTLKSKPSTKGGFYVILAGRVTTNPVGTNNFGTEGNMISSSLENTNRPASPFMYTRSFFSDNNKVRRSNLLYDFYVSVRCKMNGT